MLVSKSSKMVVAFLVVVFVCSAFAVLVLAADTGNAGIIAYYSGRANDRSIN